jgi:hypothetical protein
MGACPRSSEWCPQSIGSTVRLQSEQLSAFIGIRTRRRDTGFGQVALMANTRKNRWLIYLIGRRGMLGSVEAPDERAAIQAAIKKYQITEPERQKRLVARRWT